MKYQYNFGFFEEWIKANPQIKTNVLLKAFGVKADSGIKKWVEGRQPIPVISMLRFCNTFNVPLSVFFRDSEAVEGTTLTLCPPISNDKLEPLEGYAKERKRGEHSLFDPLDVDSIQSVVPSINDKHKNEAIEDKHVHGCFDTDTQEHATTSDFIALELKNKEQINRLLDIIFKQQKLIEDLTKSHK